MPKNYSNTAVQTALSGAVSASTTTIPVSATTGFPAAPFTLALGPGTVNEELVLVTAVAGLNLTATRGHDSTTAVAHDVGTVVQHSHSAEDFALSRQHEAATVAHGATGAVVGTTNAQVLTNKDLTSGTNTFPATLVTTAGAQTLTNKDLTGAGNTFPSSLATDAEITSAVSTHNAATVAHGATGAVVGTTNTQTLTNKTLTSPAMTDPTASGSLAGFGGAWPAYTPTFVNVVAAPDVRYTQIGKTVMVMGYFSVTSTTGAMSVSLPVPARSSLTTQAIGTWQALDVGASRYTGVTTLKDANNITFWTPSGASAVGATVPFAWAPGDTLSFQITYEAA